MIHHLVRVSSDSFVATFVFTDIEGSTRWWEREPDRMRRALARHDALSHASVQAHRGRLVKRTGDGIHAVFDEPLDAVLAVLELQQALADASAQDPGALPLQVRCGLHLGPCERRDDDYFGPVLNRTARIMGIAHGGQVLLSHDLAERVAARLPAELALRDLGSVRLRDLAAPERVHQLLHPRLRAQFPPLRSLEATPNNLAQQLDSFVGRERELGELRSLLARSRLLTLLGMGGIGKSRLSVQLGAELLDEYPDGVWLVELAPLTDARLVPQALASVLGVQEQVGQTVTASLLSHVRDKTLLLILDNCEHVLQACAMLAKQLLQAGAGVKVLASSRDVLQVAGETTYPVPALSVPADAAEVDADRLGRHEAVRLFVERASAAQARFRLDRDNAAAVAQICRRLDGIPLALELAAARTRAMSVQAIAARLDDRFRLLVSGDRTVLPRQRTLRALIDWSFELLSEPERVLFRRLAVFAGGCTLEAAEAVGAGDDLQADEVLDLLAQLVGKSLVLMEAGGARYRMLETVRAYAQEKLAAGGDEAATRGRHVECCLQLAEAARQHLAGPEQAAWLQRLDEERENLLAAHAWCGVDLRCRDRGLQLVFVLKTYWRLRGLLEVGYRITVEALGRVPAAELSFARCRVLCDAGQLAYFSGRYEQARRDLEESRRLAADIGDKGRMAAVLQPLGMTYVALGLRDQARSTYESAVALAQDVGERRQLAAALNALAQLHHANGALDDAEDLYCRVLQIARELDDPESIAIAQLNRAMVAISRQQMAMAVPMLTEVLAIAARIRSLPVEKSLLEVCAGLCANRGDDKAAARLFGAAEALGETTGIRRDANDDAFLLPLLQHARQRLGDAAFAAAEHCGRTLSADALVDTLASAMGPAPGPATPCS